MESTGSVWCRTRVISTNALCKGSDVCIIPCSLRCLRRLKSDALRSKRTETIGTFISCAGLAGPYSRWNTEFDDHDAYSIQVRMQICHDSYSCNDLLRCWRELERCVSRPFR